MMEKSRKPMTARNIIEKMKKKYMKVNKSTVYRELDFLEARKLIARLQFQEKETLFESTSKNRHYHLYCTECKKIEEVETLRGFKTFEKTLKKIHNFNMKNLSLDFYGTCSKCQ